MAAAFQRRHGRIVTAAQVIASNGPPCALLHPRRSPLSLVGLKTAGHAELLATRLSRAAMTVLLHLDVARPRLLISRAGDALETRLEARLFCRSTSRSCLRHRPRDATRGSGRAVEGAKNAMAAPEEAFVVGERTVKKGDDYEGAANNLSNASFTVSSFNNTWRYSESTLTL